VQLKQGASLVGVQWQMFAAAIIAEPIFNAAGQELVITSGSDGKHPDKKNIHGRGFALDLRTRDLKTTAAVIAVANALRAALSPAYDVVVENDHIHAEYDPKPGEA
jgi:hypothetical protein